MRLAVLGVLLAACAARPVPVPTGERTSVIGMRVWVNSPARGSYGARNQQADGLVLVRLPEKGDPTRMTETLQSNYSQGTTQYLFTAEPGRDAVVACFRRRDGRKVYSYFSEALIKKTVTEVKPRSVAYVGTLRIGVSYNLQTADDAQNHYFRTVDPRFYAAGVLERMIARTDNELEKRHKLTRDAEAEASFHKRARGPFAGSKWLARLPEP